MWVDQGFGSARTRVDFPCWMPGDRFFATLDYRIVALHATEAGLLIAYDDLDRSFGERHPSHTVLPFEWRPDPRGGRSVTCAMSGGHCRPGH